MGDICPSGTHMCLRINELNQLGEWLLYTIKTGLWENSARTVNFKRQAEAEKGREDQVMKYYQK